MIFTLCYFILALFILITVHEFGHFIIARLCGVKVLCFSFGFGKTLASWQSKRGTNYIWSALPIGGYVKMLDTREGEVAAQERHLAFNNKSTIKRIAIIIAGPLFNFIFAFAALYLALIIGVKSFLPIIESVRANSPAHLAGLRAGDVVKIINNTPIKNWYHLASFINHPPTKLLRLVVIRNGEKMTMHLDEGQGSRFTGLELTKPLQFTIEKQQFLPAVKISFIKTIELIKFNYIVYAYLFIGKIGVDNISGPIGIAKFASNAARAGISYYLSFLALLSISLGTLNLLPIPLLDGGHLLYCLIEVIQRRPLSERLRIAGVYIGLFFVITLMLVAIKNDLSHLWH